MNRLLLLSLLALFLGPLQGEEPVPDRLARGPYLQTGAPTSTIVHWRTHVTGSSMVRYGDSPAELTESLSNLGNSKEHVVTITGLKPATRYYYQVETVTEDGAVITSKVGEDCFFETSPPVGSKGKTSIWVLGDSGTGNAAARKVYQGFNATFSEGEEPHADVWLMLGDNAYSRGEDVQFQKAVFETYPRILRNSVLWPALGNHDAQTVINGVIGKPYLDIFDLPTKGEAGGLPSGTEYYYSFDYANIHFVCLDSETRVNFTDVPGGGGMYDWLEADLQANQQDWLIVFFHHPPYTKGSHDSDKELKHIQMRHHFLPLLESYGVDLCLGGHSHCYERSYLIKGHYGAESGSVTFNPKPASEGGNIVDRGNGSTRGIVDEKGQFQLDSAPDGAYEKVLGSSHSGAVYSVAGASGKLSKWHNGSKALVHPAPHPAHLVNLRLMGSMIIEVEGYTMNVRYLDGKGETRDDFTIQKVAPVEKP